MNPNRPAWMPSLTDIERESLKALAATLFVALVLSHWPAARSFVRSAWKN